jgi:hypothetical protein
MDIKEMLRWTQLRKVIGLDNRDIFEVIIAANKELVEYPTKTIIGGWSGCFHSLLSFIHASKAINCFEALAEVVAPNSESRYAKFEISAHGVSCWETDIMKEQCIISLGYSSDHVQQKLVERWMRAGVKMGWRVQEASDSSSQLGWEMSIFDALWALHNKRLEQKDVKPGELNWSILEMLINCSVLGPDDAMKILNPGKASEVSWRNLTSDEYMRTLEREALRLEASGAKKKIECL